MTDKIAPLKQVIGTIGAGANPDGYLNQIQKYLIDSGILETTVQLGDVELENAQPDERRLGKLTRFESECFIIGTLLSDLMREEIVELEASGSEEITKIMRRQKVNMATAAAQYADSAEVPLETRTLFNRAAVAHTNVMSNYEWSVRTRFDEWGCRLIVRRDYVVYSYGWS